MAALLPLCYPYPSPLSTRQGGGVTYLQVSSEGGGGADALADDGPHQLHRGAQIAWGHKHIQRHTHTHTTTTTKHTHIHTQRHMATVSCGTMGMSTEARA